MSDAATQKADGGLDRIYDAIEAVVPGVNHAVVQMVVWDTLDEFCTKSTFWRATVQWTLQPSVQAVNLNPVSGNALVRHVLALRPSRLSANLPGSLVDDWQQAIRDGALAALYGQPAKSYSSGALAQYHRRQFLAAIREARSQAMRYNSGEQTSGWVFPGPWLGR